MILLSPGIHPISHQTNQETSNELGPITSAHAGL